MALFIGWIGGSSCDPTKTKGFRLRTSLLISAALNKIGPFLKATAIPPAPQPLANCLLLYALLNFKLKVLLVGFSGIRIGSSLKGVRKLATRPSPLGPIYLNFFTNFLGLLQRYFVNVSTPASFLVYSLFPNDILEKKIVGFSGMRIWVAGIEGKHADH